MDDRVALVATALQLVGVVFLVVVAYALDPLLGTAVVGVGCILVGTVIERDRRPQRPDKRGS